jgi:hypothetical protein
MSLNILGLTGAVWEMTDLVETSTFITAPQQGQVKSKLDSRFATGESYRNT